MGYIAAPPQSRVAAVAEQDSFAGAFCGLRIGGRPREETHVLTIINLPHHNHNNMLTIFTNYPTTSTTTNQNWPKTDQQINRTTATTTIQQQQFNNNNSTTTIQQQQFNNNNSTTTIQKQYNNNNNNNNETSQIWQTKPPHQLLRSVQERGVPISIIPVDVAFLLAKQNHLF